MRKVAVELDVFVEVEIGVGTRVEVEVGFGGGGGRQRLGLAGAAEATRRPPGRIKNPTPGRSGYSTCRLGARGDGRCSCG